MGDSITGFDAAPDRYMTHGRETIDRQRDFAHEAARAVGGGALAGDAKAVAELADLMFAFHCQAQVMKYRDRSGLKGDAAADMAKAEFYQAMLEHVLKGTPDPRSGRPDFTPYQRPTGR